jgi:hypothetical protein
MFKSNKRNNKNKPNAREPNKALVYKNDGQVCSMNMGLLSLRSTITGDRRVRMEQVIPYWQTFTTSTSAATSKSYTFQMSDLTGIADIASVFDNFRILGVEVLISPRIVGPNTDLLDLTTAIDFDGNPPPTASGIAQYSTALTTSTNQQQIRSFRPMWANQVYNTTTAYSNGPSDQWLDIAYPTIPHYGLLLYSGIATTATDFRIDVKYTFEVRLIK